MVMDGSGKLSEAGEFPDRENSSRDLRDPNRAPEPTELQGTGQIPESEGSPSALRDGRDILKAVFEVPAKGTSGAPAGEARGDPPEELRGALPEGV